MQHLKGSGMNRYIRRLNHDGYNNLLGFSKISQDRRRYSALPEACLEEAGDGPAFIVHALGVISRARNMNQLARDTGLTREDLYKALSSERNPSFSTVAKLVKALGFKLTVRPLV